MNREEVNLAPKSLNGVTGETTSTPENANNYKLGLERQLGR